MRDRDVEVRRLVLIPAVINGWFIGRLAGDMASYRRAGVAVTA